MTGLELRDVHRTHGTGEATVQALRGVSLRVAAGELVAVMGPSGSGKSTLLALAGAGVATFGVVRVDSAVVLAGLVLAELGLVVGTPSLIGVVDRLGRALPLAPRIALRDAARNRASAAPAVRHGGRRGQRRLRGVRRERRRADGPHTHPNAAGRQRLPRARLRSGRAAGAGGVPAERVRAALTATLPVERIADVHDVACGPQDATLNCRPYPVRPPERVCPYTSGELTRAQQRLAAKDPRCDTAHYYLQGDGGPTTVVDDGSAVGLLTGASGDDLARTRRTLLDGGVVVADASLVKDGRTIVQLDEGRTVTVPGHHLTTGVVASTTRMPSQDERDAFEAARAELGQRYDGGVAMPFTSDDGRVTLLVLTIAAAVIALGAAGIATGLAAVDSRPDLTTLAAVGASPALRRRLALSQAGVISGLGSLLGVAVGAGAGLAVIAALNRERLVTWPAEPAYPLVVPWLNIAVAALVVPAIAMAGSALLTRSRLPVERRRA